MAVLSVLVSDDTVGSTMLVIVGVAITPSQRTLVVVTVVKGGILITVLLALDAVIVS